MGIFYNCFVLCILHSSITTANFENVRNFTGHEEVYPLAGVVPVYYAAETRPTPLYKTVGATLSGTANSRNRIFNSMQDWVANNRAIYQGHHTEAARCSDPESTVQFSTDGIFVKSSDGFFLS